MGQMGELRHADSEALLGGLIRQGLLEKALDLAEEHRPNLYRITAAALAATRHPSLESLRAAIAASLAADAVDAQSSQSLAVRYTSSTRIP